MKRQKCARCGATNPPETTSAHSVISVVPGWRLARRRKRDGSVALDWYCQPCWQLRGEEAAPAVEVAPNADSEARRSFVTAVASLGRGTGQR